jgi:hypothetical protein
VLAIRRRLASLGDDLVDGREPRLLKRPTLASRKRECRLMVCQRNKWRITSNSALVRRLALIVDSPCVTCWGSSA